MPSAGYPAFLQYLQSGRVSKFATTAVGIKGRSRPTLQHARAYALNSLLLVVGFGVG